MCTLDAFQCERTALALSTSSRSALKALVCVLFRVRVKLLFTLVLRTPDGMVRDRGVGATEFSTPVVQSNQGDLEVVQIFSDDLTEP
jgi:hypothetical protein